MAMDNLAPLEEEILRHLFTISPDGAVGLGLHEYDGLLPPLSKDSIKNWLAKTESYLETISAFDKTGLPARRALDAELLQMLLERGTFDFKELRVHEEDPLTYCNSLHVQSYISREYAPVNHRVDAIVRHLKTIPRFLDFALENLSKTLPEPHVKIAITVAQGTPANYQEAEPIVEKATPELKQEFQTAKKGAVQAIDAFVKALQEEYLPHAKPDFALGGEKLAKLLWVNDRIDKSLSELLEMGLSDIEKNKQEFLETARKLDPSKSPREVKTQIALEHSTAESLIRDTANLLEDIRGFIVAHDLVAIPSEERCSVTETPTYARGMYTAALNPPGTFEAGSPKAFYYVTPVDKNWSPEKQEEWLRYLNTASLKDISIHEAYPGHYVHFLHLRRMQTKASKTFISYAFTEGWAHYCEEMMLQEGYNAGDVKLKLAQLQGALVRDCRYVCSIKMHTGEFTLEQAIQYFMENAFVDRLPAEREALRGTYDPGYFSYTLGKLYIKQVRKEYFSRHLGSTPKQFHDDMLLWGAPPVGLLGKLLS